MATRVKSPPRTRKGVVPNEANAKGVEIGNRIVQARREAGGMTQAELAALLHVSPRSVQAYEAGEVIPYRQLRDLERALGKPAAWFLHGEAALVATDEQHEELMREIRALRSDLSEVLKRLADR